MTTRNAHERRPRSPTSERARHRILAGSRRSFRVVVGVDFSGASLAAARWAARAFGPGADLVLVNVLPAAPHAPAVIRTGRAARSRDDAHAMLGALRGLGGLLGVGRVEAIVRRGVVADVLAAVAARVRARYVCIGRDIVDGLPALRLAERLLARTSLGVIVVPGATNAAPNRVAALVDGGAGSLAVLREATSVFGRVSTTTTSRDAARLTVLHRPADDPGGGRQVIPVADIASPHMPLGAPALARWTRSAGVSLAHRLRSALTTPRSAEASPGPSSGTSAANAERASAVSPPFPHAPAVDLLVLARRYRPGGHVNRRLETTGGRDVDAAGAPDEVGGTTCRGLAALDPLVRAALGRASCPVLVVPRLPTSSHRRRRIAAGPARRGHHRIALTDVGRPVPPIPAR